MYDDDIPIDLHLAKKLIKTQFPHLSNLQIERVNSVGTDNSIYKLGEEMAVRLPRTPSAALHLEKELRWLPMLNSHLPIAIPIPLGKGVPGEGYSFSWAIYNWLEGENATLERISDERQTALDLARFVVALQKIDASGGPQPGDHNFFRGVPLAMRDAAIRNAIPACTDLIDTAAATAAWEAALYAPIWDAAPVWIHGDIHAGNLLAANGRISGVIDFGGLGVGDPACDLLVAWWLLTSGGREVFRAELGVDEAMWERGRGWALSMGLIALPYYIDSNPILAGMAKRAIEEVLGEN